MGASRIAAKDPKREAETRKEYDQALQEVISQSERREQQIDSLRSSNLPEREGALQALIESIYGLDQPEKECWQVLPILCHTLVEDPNRDNRQQVLDLIGEYSDIRVTTADRMMEALFDLTTEYPREHQRAVEALQSLLDRNNIDKLKDWQESFRAILNDADDIKIELSVCHIISKLGDKAEALIGDLGNRFDARLASYGNKKPKTSADAKLELNLLGKIVQTLGVLAPGDIATGIKQARYHQLIETQGTEAVKHARLDKISNLILELPQLEPSNSQISPKIEQAGAYLRDGRKALDQRTALAYSLLELALNQTSTELAKKAFLTVMNHDESKFRAQALHLLCLCIGARALKTQKETVIKREANALLGLVIIGYSGDELLQHDSKISTRLALALSRGQIDSGPTRAATLIGRLGTDADAKKITTAIRNCLKRLWDDRKVCHLTEPEPEKQIAKILKFLDQLKWAVENLNQPTEKTLSQIALTRDKFAGELRILSTPSQTLSEFCAEQ